MTRIAGSVIDNRPTPFPEGVYLGTLKEVNSRWNPENTRLSFTLIFRDVTVIEGEKEPGARPYRCRIPVIWDGDALADYEEIDDKVREDMPFPLARAAMLVSSLILAFRAGERGEDTSMDVDLEEFLEQLEEGAFNDEEVVFEVQHREWKSKDGKRSGVSDDPIAFQNPEDFYAAQEETASKQLEDAVEAEAEAEEPEAEPEQPKRKPKSLRRR